MKKFRTPILFICLIVLACDQDSFIDRSATAPRSVMSFHSNEEFDAVLNKIPSMSDQELDAWEHENSFVSYRSIINEAYHEWETITTEEDKQLFLNQYKDVLTLQQDVLVPSIDIPLYQSIANRDGIYETAGYLNKIVGDYIVSAEKKDREKLKEVTSVDEREFKRLSKNPGFRVFKYTDSDKTSARTSAACTTYHKASYFHNESNCRNDREVHIAGKSYIMISRTFEGDWYQPRVYIEVWGLRRRATWCDWISYNTALQYANVSFTVTAWAIENRVAVQQSYSKLLPDKSTTTDTSHLTWDEPIGVRLLNQYITAFPFTQLHAEGTSRGVAGVWVVIDCQ